MDTSVVNTSALAEQHTLTGERIELRQLTGEHLAPYLAMLADPESNRLTGSHGELHEDAVRQWLATRPGKQDRADWAILRRADGAFLGEIVLNQLSAPDASMNVRIILAGAELFGRGYGTEAMRLVIAHGIDVIRLHRISLGVYAFNPRAIRSYQKCGFVREGVLRDALHADGEWHDEIVMSILATDPR